MIVDPQPISTAQLAFFSRKWASNTTFARGRGNNRMTQPIGDRIIYFYNGEAASGAVSLVSMMIAGLMMGLLAIIA